MPAGSRLLRNLDLAVLAIALPVYVVAGFPMLGWAAATGAWLCARLLQALLDRRALARGDRRAALRARAGALIARLYLVGLAVLAAGIVEREAGVAAGALAAVVFTVFFASQFVVNSLEERS